MCFDRESETVYEHSEESRPNSLAEVLCSECSEVVPSGERYLRVWLQEYEECQFCCEEVGFHDWDFGCEDDSAHDVGETEVYNCCLRCEYLRKAIRVVEEARGCVGAEAEPKYWDLHGGLLVCREDAAHKYLARARQMFPELPQEYLQRMFGTRYFA